MDASPVQGTPSISVLRTKLNRPGLPSDIVARPALLNKLERAWQRPLTLVSAPAGYGKTTVVSQWLEENKRPAAWLSLDERDNALPLFLIHFVAALQTVLPTFGHRIAALLETPDLPPVSSFVELLLNELQEHADPFIFVLDDYHFIHYEAIHELVAGLLRHPPRSLHLVIITRRDPPLPLSSLRAQGTLGEIRAQDLRFLQEETTTFLQQIVSAPIEQRVAVQLEAKTEGWVTGLRLAALSLRGVAESDSLLAGMSGEGPYVMDYLFSEVFARQPSDIQTYLLKTSILDRFCASLCEYIVGGETDTVTPVRDGSAFVQYLKESNLFCLPLDNQHCWFRCHHLFQQLLQNEARKQLEQDEITRLHLRASAWLGQSWLPEQ